MSFIYRAHYKPWMWSQLEGTFEGIWREYWHWALFIKLDMNRFVCKSFTGTFRWTEKHLFSARVPKGCAHLHVRKLTNVSLDFSCRCQFIQWVMSYSLQLFELPCQSFHINKQNIHNYKKLTLLIRHQTFFWGS